MKEHEIQLKVCRYIKAKYPRAKFNSDMAGEFIGRNGSKNWQQLKKISLQRSSDGFPDLVIYEKNEKHIGLAIELKTINGTPYLKDGQYAKNYRKGGKKFNQIIWLNHLQKLGFYATFGVGYDETIKIIDNYFKNEL